jgi:serine/threonine protein phosphatase PrpC
MAAATTTFRAAGATDVGRIRERNEDRFHVDIDRGVFIVADGVGGQSAGDTAAEIAIGSMRERLARKTGSPADRLREAIVLANNEIHRLAATRPDWRGMACVLTAAIIDGDRACVGHVGDSRLYRLQGQRIEKITPDHSPVGEREDANEISEQQAMQHPRRNEVYRDVGSEPRSPADPNFAFVTEIDLPPDAALLICSDGLTDLVPADTIRRIAASRAGSPEDVVQGLIAAANEEGGKDNITAVFIERPQFRAGANGASHSRARGRWLASAAIIAAGLAGLLIGLNFDALGWLSGGSVNVRGLPAEAIVVRAGESITDAIERALPGTDVIVEPGEYRERLTLRDHVRVLSRVPQGAVLRLPGVAAERDAAVLAAGVTNAELTGFRIVGDAATPLGVGVFTRDAVVRLDDLDVSGANTAAFDIGSGGTGGEVSLIGSQIHDNPGSALIIRTGASPRLTQNVFQRNASSERAAAAFVIERDALPVWARNVFQGIGPEAIAGTDEARRTSLVKDNWFPGVPAPAVPPTGRGRRGQ